MILFWGNQPNDKIGKNCFSQWFPSEFTIDSVKFNCCEQYMMAMKARLFKDEDAYNKIMSMTDPRDIKAMGRKVKNFNEEIWNENCRKIVFDANFAKFTQNEALKNFLLSTKDELIAEASPYDRIWGIGMSADNPSIKNQELWGTNWLGKAIMEVRSKISAEKLKS